MTETFKGILPDVSVDKGLKKKPTKQWSVFLSNKE